MPLQKTNAFQCFAFWSNLDNLIRELTRMLLESGQKCNYDLILYNSRLNNIFVNVHFTRIETVHVNGIASVKS